MVNGLFVFVHSFYWKQQNTKQYCTSIFFFWIFIFVVDRFPVKFWNSEFYQFFFSIFFLSWYEVLFPIVQYKIWLISLLTITRYYSFVKCYEFSCNEFYCIVISKINVPIIYQCIKYYYIKSMYNIKITEIKCYIFGFREKFKWYLTK